jgi:hypothetical protein
MKKTCVIIDITHLINQKKIKRNIYDQLEDLGISQYFHEECSVKFVNGTPNYKGYICDKHSGEQLILNSDYCVTRALLDRVS